MSTDVVQVFRLPDLGEGLTEAGLVQWLVKVGDVITTDQAIAEVETAKSVVELPSPFAGVVTALHGEPGDTIDVGAPVLEVAGADASAEHEAYRTEERAGSGNVLIGYGTSERRTAGGRRRRPAAASRPAAPAAASGRAARAAVSSPAASSHQAGAADASHPSVQADQASARTDAGGPAATRDTNAGSRRTVAVRSPLVRRLARDLGLDVRTIVATGTDGAVTRADVLRAAVDHAVDGVGAAAARGSRGDEPEGTAAEDGELDGLAVRSRTRMSPLRKAANATLTRSRSEIPEATVWVDVDATALWDARREMAPEGGQAPSLTALLARFVLIALAEHPLLAARLNDDATEIVELDGVNLGIAADTARGLMVPVIPRAHALSVAELDAALRTLTADARSGSVAPERLRGSTFTLNNYGGLGVDGSAAIINHPDVAILGIGRIMQRPWVVDGAIVVRRIAQLSLVFDHRVCDGGYAASFLRRVTELIEHPLRAFGSL